jgi:hypothetical protein
LDEVADPIEGAGNRDADVIEQQRGAAMCGGNDIGECGDRLAIRNVKLVAGDADVRVLEQAGRFGKASFVDIGKREMTAAPRQRPRDRAANAPARAGNDGGTVLQPHARLSSRSESFENTSAPSSIVAKRSASMSLA